MKLFELFATLALNTQDFVKGVNNAGKQAKGFANTVQTRFTAASVAIGNLTARGIAKVADAGVKMVKDSLNVVKEFEQNLGGSEAVFGDWAKTVQETGSKAYKNMGLSLSDYLATANKMGSLFKGAGYTTGEAMDMTTKAMQRAADVASIMGVDAEWAMESIAGLAKGNFTMMDNLGVAINDTALANYALEKGIKKSVSAMSTQEKIGLALELFMERTAEYAGNYAKENTTLAGSYEVLGAAYENMLIGQEGATDDFVDALGVAAKATMKNLGEIVPRLGQSMWQGIQRAAPRVKAAFVNLWDNELPGLATRAANGLIGTINDVFGTNIPTIGSINFPTWDKIESGFYTWWKSANATISDVANFTVKFLGFAEWTNDDTKAIKDWWANAAQIIDETVQWILDPQTPAITKTANLIISWWSDVVSNVGSLTINIVPRLVSGVKPMINDLTGIDPETAQQAEDIIMDTAESYINDPVETLKEASKKVPTLLELMDAFQNQDAPGVGKKFPTSNRVGLDYVPYDNYLSNLHEGEAVLTKAEAEKYRRNQGFGSTERLESIMETVSEKLDALGNMVVVLNGQAVGAAVAPVVSRQIYKDTKSKHR